MAGWIAGAVVVGSLIAADSASSAADTQAGAAREAGVTSLEGLRLQLASDKDTLDKQLAAQKSALDQTLAAQKLAADTGNTVAKEMLTQQLGAQQSALDQTLGLQREMFNKQIENLRSYKEAGEAGQTRLLELLGLGGDKKAPDFGSATTAFKVEGFDPNTLLQQFNNGKRSRLRVSFG